MSSNSGCFKNRCKNNSTCFEISSGEYGCSCQIALKLRDGHAQVGFSGAYCETVQIPCSPNPCFNDGVCYTTHNGEHYCDCKSKQEKFNY